MGKRKRNYPEWMNEEQAIGILHSLICLYDDEHDKADNEWGALHYLVAHLKDLSPSAKGEEHER